MFREFVYVNSLNSSNPFLIVGANSNNVSNGNAGPGYVNNWNGNMNTNNGARLAISINILRSIGPHPLVKYRTSKTDVVA